MKIFRHEKASEKHQLGPESTKDLEVITTHIEKFWGPIETTFHELVSDYVHIDVHFVAPTAERPFRVLVTSGMSDRPMTASPGAEDFTFGELVIALPPDWPLDENSTKDENNWWPVRWLKQLARFPHEYETLLGFGHTIPNGDPAEPFAPNTGFCCTLLCQPVLADDGCEELVVRPDKTIHFYSFIPIYREEMEFALEHGSRELIGKLSDAGATELLDLQRPNVIHRNA